MCPNPESKIRVDESNFTSEKYSVKDEELYYWLKSHLFLVDSVKPSSFHLIPLLNLLP